MSTDNSEQPTQINIDIRNDGERFHIEKEQPILLRLPEEEAEVLRKQIQEGKVDLHINLEDGCSGTCVFNDKQYSATLVTLPCVVETHKSYDDVALFKTGDIGQAIIIHDDDHIPKIDKHGRLKSGLTPPTNRIVSKFKKLPSEAEQKKMAKLESEVTQQGVGSGKSDDDGD
ncbi:TAFII55 protein conserved region domain-containing protein [Entamoeba marina]